jgi:hypothetical protein
MATTPRHTEEGSDSPNEKRFSYAAGLAATLFYLAISGFHVLATSPQLPFILGKFEGADEIASLALTLPLLAAMVGSLFFLIIFAQGLKLCTSRATNERLEKILAVLWNGAFYSLSALTIAFLLAIGSLGTFVLAVDSTARSWTYLYFCFDGFLVVLGLRAVGRFLRHIVTGHVSQTSWSLIGRVLSVGPFVLGLLFVLALAKQLLPAFGITSLVFLTLATIELLGRLELYLRLDRWSIDLGRNGKIFFFCFGVVSGWLIPNMFGSYAQDLTAKLERTSDGAMLKLYPKGLISLEQRADGCFGGIDISLTVLGNVQVSPVRNDVGSKLPVCWYSSTYPRIVGTASGAPEIQYRISMTTLNYPSCAYRISVSMPSVRSRFGPNPVVRQLEFGPLGPSKGFYCG